MTNQHPKHARNALAQKQFGLFNRLVFTGSGHKYFWHCTTSVVHLKMQGLCADRCTMSFLKMLLDGYTFFSSTAKSRLMKGPLDFHLLSTAEVSFCKLCHRFHTRFFKTVNTDRIQTQNSTGLHVISHFPSFCKQIFPLYPFCCTSDVFWLSWLPALSEVRSVGGKDANVVWNSDSH